MRRLYYPVTLLPWLLGLGLIVGCPNEAKNARDSIAAASGYLTAAKAQYATTCKTTPADSACQTISKAAEAENLAITALEVYCSGTPAAGQQPFGQGGPCVADTSAQPKLDEAVASLNAVIANVKGLIK